MLKRLRTAHPILYCILAEVLFLGSLFLSSLVLTVALVAAGAEFSGLDEYLLSLVQELVGAGAAWLLPVRPDRAGQPDPGGPGRSPVHPAETERGRVRGRCAQRE